MDRHTNQWNDIKIPEINTYTHGQQFLTMVPKYYSGRDGGGRQSFQQMKKQSFQHLAAYIQMNKHGFQLKITQKKLAQNGSKP